MTAKKKIEEESSKKMKISSSIRQLVTAPPDWFVVSDDLIYPVPCLALLDSGEGAPLIFDNDRKQLVNALLLENFEDLLCLSETARTSSIEEAIEERLKEDTEEEDAESDEEDESDEDEDDEDEDEDEDKDKDKD